MRAASQHTATEQNHVKRRYFIIIIIIIYFAQQFQYHNEIRCDIKKLESEAEHNLQPARHAHCATLHFLFLPTDQSKVKFSHTRYRALGPELIPVYRQSAHRWLEAIHLAVGCHYFQPGLRLPSLPSQRASPPIGRYQIILLGDRGTCVWAACPRLLPVSGPAEIRTRDLLDRERTLYR